MTTALPTDLSQFPARPERVEIEPLHLSMNQTWESGSSHNIHLLKNSDIGVILKGVTRPSARERIHRGRLPATEDGARSGCGGDLLEQVEAARLVRKTRRP